MLQFRAFNLYFWVKFYKIDNCDRTFIDWIQSEYITRDELVQDVHLPPQLLEYFYSLMNSKVLKSQTTFSDDDNVPVDFSIAIANPS